MTPRLAVVDFRSWPAGSQNLWAYAVADPNFAAVEAHVVLQAGHAPPPAVGPGVRVHRFGGRAARVVKAVAARAGMSRDPLASTVASVDPDIVWFNLAGLGETGWVAPAAEWCRANGVPYWVIVQHVHEPFFFLGDAHEREAHAVMAGARRVLTVSERNRAALAVAFADRLPNVEHAVNGVPPGVLADAARVAASNPPRADGTARFISPARLDPVYKGQHLLFAALGGPAWRDRDWSLTCLGGGPLAELTRRLVGFHGLPASRVTFAGHRDDVLAAFAESDVIVMPSLSEGFPYSLVEGMACGRAAVGTPVGGIGEMVRDGVTGWLARTVDVADVTAAMERCWADRGRWAAFGRAAAARAAEVADLGVAHRRLLANMLADASARGR